MREIVLDTETTGLDARGDDRVIEIGCIEIFNRIPTGEEYHCFINPERDVPAEAEAVHGLSTAFLADKPVFKKVIDDFLKFIGDDILVIHNAPFDIGFLNAEFERLGRPALVMDRVVDTLQLARRKHPSGPNNLDALCKRYGIDNSKRTKHGALVDSLLLADVYVELLGERQAALLLGVGQDASDDESQSGRQKSAKKRAKPLPSRLSQDELDAHLSFVKKLGKEAVWRQYLDLTDTDSSAKPKSS
ncbi:MAG: DNA polymerase III subunit epsilon [Alphaproteobacteria bacterium]|nr:DNA polymerase III subunit epsilon [Alphaproteobacteria bacterium]